MTLPASAGTRPATLSAPRPRAGITRTRVESISSIGTFRFEQHEPFLSTALRDERIGLEEAVKASGTSLLHDAPR